MVDTLAGLTLKKTSPSHGYCFCLWPVNDYTFLQGSAGEQSLLVSCTYCTAMIIDALSLNERTDKWRYINLHNYHFFVKVIDEYCSFPGLYSRL